MEHISNALERCLTGPPIEAAPPPDDDSATIFYNLPPEPPLEALPPEIRQMLQASLCFLQTRAHRGASGGISELFDHLRRPLSRALEVKSSWQEAGNIYIALVGNSGVGKSHCFNVMLKPVWDEDFRRKQEWEAAMADYHKIMDARSKDKSAVLTEPPPKSASNPDIDYDRSALNYDIHNSGPVDFGKVIDQRIGQLVLNKKIRHDAVYMCGLMVSSDSEFFKKLGANEPRRFFQAAYEYLSDFVGKENIISAVVHLDETTPHLHFAHVPITQDGRLAANKIYDRKDETLSRLHSGLSSRLKEYGFKIERGGRGKGKVHLNTKEFKEQRETLKELDTQAEAKRQELASTQTELDQALAHLRALSEQAREAEIILQQEPEPPKPTMLNYKSVCDGHVQRLELLKKALADKRAIEDRNRKLEASHKAIASELKVLRMKDGLDEMEKNQAAQEARKELQRVENEKRQLKAALTEAREFINQPEVRAMYEKYQASKQEPAQNQAPEEALYRSHTTTPEERKPCVSMGR